MNRNSLLQSKVQKCFSPAAASFAAFAKIWQITRQSCCYFFYFAKNTKLKLSGALEKKVKIAHDITKADKKISA